MITAEDLRKTQREFQYEADKKELAAISEKLNSMYCKSSSFITVNSLSLANEKTLTIHGYIITRITDPRDYTETITISW